ncbi:unnamed protein product [Mytilus edulis]|uniref:Tesmin/TSO1-like CXC domain-containing protein n=2 Tax=Mytilus TaxID=6548 RepID=A0A8S3QF70_MYTED|nr:unnamed protein product [Mytilus edulis]
MLDELLKGDISVEKACDDVLIDQIKSRIDNFRESHKSYRTSQLWFQYMDMIDILRRFIKAERTGNWELHLQTVKDMLPYLAASGHNLYVKSSRVYLQQMENLKTTHPEVLAFLQSGHHVIRRSDKFWAGLSSDLVIEQVLMRSLKTTGGMTRGRGMSEGQRAQWILSMPDCAEMNNALQEFTGVNYGTSDQHKEGGESRRSRDCQDLKTFLSFLISRSPFVEETSLRNIETGVSADKFVNVDNSKELGIKILKSMDGKKIDEFSFKRKEQATILSAKSAIKVDDDVIIVDSQLLFQRFLAASNGIYEDQSEIFTYELCSHPSSMFDPNGLMRTAQKSSLADAIWGKGDCCAFEMSENDETQYVIDGGSLLHRIHWQSGLSFGEICQRYIDSVERKYSKAIVVFDGYASGPDTKDATHQRRTKGIIGTKVSFTDRTPFKSKKEIFLANIENKQNFINLLSAKMVEKGIKTKHADADADVLIALTAIESAKTKATVLLGEDTDLLVLLLHHADVTSNSLIFKSGNVSKVNTHIKIWDILKTKLLLGEELCTFLPLIHAISGCDTTSRMFGVSKAATLKKFGEHDFLKTQAQLLCNANANDDVISAGENIISSLYNGAPYEGLNVLRYRKFAARVLTNKTCVQIHTLPPTSNAASFHSQRAYLQMKMWMNKDNLNPCEWGWKVANGNLVPVKCTMDAAPSKLLNIIRCNCKTNCDTKRCTCRKNGLECSVACGECKGTGCTNSSKTVDMDD